MCTNLSFLVSPHRLVSRKSTHGQSTLQISQTQGYTLFRVSPHLTTKEHPCHVYSDLTTSKQITGQNITYNGTTTGTQHCERHHVTVSSVLVMFTQLAQVYCTAAALAVSLLQTGIIRAQPVPVK